MNEQITGSKLYKIDFECRGKYLFAHVEGETDSLEVSLQFWTQILQQARLEKFPAVLVVENFKTNISTFETYMLNQKLGEMGFYNIRIAFVDEHPEHNEINQFGETVANNRGLIMKVFQTIESAEKWLLEK